MDSLFEELITFGFLKKSETVALKDYVGETPLPSACSQAKEWCPRPPATVFLAD